MNAMTFSLSLILKKTEMIFLQVGGNDLSNEQRSAEQVAHGIHSFACYLHIGMEVKYVIKCNTKLLSLCQERFSNVIFWRRHGFWTDPWLYLSRDEVHLNYSGMLKYLRSVRSAVLHSQTLGNISFSYFFSYIELCIVNQLYIKNTVLKWINIQPNCSMLISTFISTCTIYILELDTKLFTI